MRLHCYVKLYSLCQDYTNKKIFVFYVILAHLSNGTVLLVERWKNDQTSSLTDIQETLNNLDKGLHKLETGDIRDIQLSLAKLIEQVRAELSLMWDIATMF